MGSKSSSIPCPNFSPQAISWDPPCIQGSLTFSLTPPAGTSVYNQKQGFIQLLQSLNEHFFTFVHIKYITL